MARVKIPPGQKVILCLIFAPFVIGAFFLFRDGRRSAEYSAHSALTAEVVSNLTFIAWGDRHFPKALSELPLRFPDGGDASLLRKFHYASSGTGCILRTRLPYSEEESVWKF